jgi:hypothetical protein
MGVRPAIELDQDRRHDLGPGQEFDGPTTTRGSGGVARKARPWPSHRPGSGCALVEVVEP